MSKSSDPYAADRLPDDERWTASGRELYVGKTHIATFEPGTAAVCKWIAELADAVVPMRRGALRIRGLSDRTDAALAEYRAKYPEEAKRAGI